METQSISNSLTPAEIKNKEFKKILRGYCPREVVEFLDLVARSWEKVQKHEKSLLREMEGLRSELSTWRSKEEELEQLKVKAHKEAKEIREEASRDAAKTLQKVEQQAQEIRKNTEDWLAKVIKQLEETQERKMSFLNSFKASLDSHYQLLETENMKVEPLEGQLSVFLKEQQRPRLNS